MAKAPRHTAGTTCVTCSAPLIYAVPRAVAVVDPLCPRCATDIRTELRNLSAVVGVALLQLQRALEALDAENPQRARLHLRRATTRLQRALAEDNGEA